MLDENIILRTDSYKASHFLQMPPDTEFQNSYIESRGGEWNHTVFFGLQMFLKQYLSKPVTVEMVDEAERFFTAHGEPFNREGWMYIVTEHNGYLPLKIEAVAEGTVVPTSNVLVQVVNTDPKCFWLTSYMETALLRAVWYPTTVATNSFMTKQAIYSELELTADDPDGEIGFKLHDFGARGVSSAESAGIGGAAHLVNFMGSDTVEGVRYAKRFYNDPMAGFSIPASEHSTITSWKKESGAFRNMIEKFGGNGKMFACVSDSYDIFNAVENIWGKELVDVIPQDGTLVIRPDSGDPVETPVAVVEKAIEVFGAEPNRKGYLVLPPYVRIIQGDGVSAANIKKILGILRKKGISASNIGFGQGGALLQQVNRDTLQFAMKCSAIKTKNGLWRDVYKEPVTDKGKTSKKGVLALERRTGIGAFNLRTRLKIEVQQSDNQLRTVYKNGKLFNLDTFADIRTRATEGLVTNVVGTDNGDLSNQ